MLFSSLPVEDKISLILRRFFAQDGRVLGQDYEESADIFFKQRARTNMSTNANNHEAKLKEMPLQALHTATKSCSFLFVIKFKKKN